MPGTVAEYEPAKRLKRRTAGIRVVATYTVLILGLVAWFAWIPVAHAAEEEHASSLTLIFDSMLAITFVTALESTAFGLIPMRFLDGDDLYSWRKGLWALMWGRRCSGSPSSSSTPRSVPTVMLERPRRSGWSCSSPY